MRKSAFSLMPDIQEDIKKRSKAMKELKKVTEILDQEGKMYDNRTDTFVELKECQNSTLNRYATFITKLLKYTDSDDTQKKLRLKIKEIEKAKENNLFWGELTNTVYEMTGSKKRVESYTHQKKKK